MTTIFSDDFESGSLAAYTVSTDGSAVCAANATAALAGANGLQSNVVSGANFAVARKGFTTPGSGILSLKFKAKIISSTGGGTDFCNIRVAGNTNITYVRLDTPANRFEIWSQPRDGSGEVSTNATGGLPSTGVQFDCELVYNKADGAHGSVPTSTLYIDNVQVAQWVDPSASGTPADAAIFVLGLYQHFDGTTPQAYYDDLLVSDAFVGGAAPPSAPFPPFPQRVFRPQGQPAALYVRPAQRLLPATPAGLTIYPPYPTRYVVGR